MTVLTELVCYIQWWLNKCLICKLHVFTNNSPMQYTCSTFTPVENVLVSVHVLYELVSFYVSHPFSHIPVTSQMCYWLMSVNTTIRLWNYLQCCICFPQKLYNKHSLSVFHNVVYNITSSIMYSYVQFNGCLLCYILLKPVEVYGLHLGVHLWPHTNEILLWISVTKNLNCPATFSRCLLH
jgi:hypothetical protein